VIVANIEHGQHAEQVVFWLQTNHLHGVHMGKGDKRTKRGKIFKHSYGKTRPHDPQSKKSEAAPKHRAQRGQPGR
jgi:ribosomal small subunit protein bTHX